MCIRSTVVRVDCSCSVFGSCLAWRCQVFVAFSMLYINVTHINVTRGCAHLSQACCATMHETEATASVTGPAV